MISCFGGNWRKLRGAGGGSVEGKERVKGDAVAGGNEEEEEEKKKTKKKRIDCV